MSAFEGDDSGTRKHGADTADNDPQAGRRAAPQSIEDVSGAGATAMVDAAAGTQERELVDEKRATEEQESRAKEVVVVGRRSGEEHVHGRGCQSSGGDDEHDHDHDHDHGHEVCGNGSNRVGVKSPNRRYCFC